MDKGLEIVRETARGWELARAVGRIDTLTAPEAERELKALVGGRLALDLSQLDYISSAGLRVLLRLAKAAGRSGSELVLVGACGMVREVLEESGMEALFTMYETVASLPD